MRSIGLFLLLIFGVLVPTAVWAQEVDAPDSAESEQSDPASDDPVLHTVAAGDTLFTIAQLYDTTIAELERLNSLAPDAVLQIGQTLIISGFVPLPIGATVIDAPDLQQVAGLPNVPKRHTVQGGETLSALAAQYDVSAETLIEVNQLDSAETLAIGQQLTIPGVQGEIFARDYVVRFGDTLAGIAAQFNTTPALLLEEKSLMNPDSLIVGQTLRIVSRTGSAEPAAQRGTPHVVQPDETLLSIAAQHNLPPQMVAQANGLHYPTPVYAGTRLRIPTNRPYRTLSAELTTLNISSEPLRQGEAFTVYLESATAITPSAVIRFTDVISTPIRPWFYQTYAQEIPFAPFADGYVAIAGLDSFVHPGLYEVALNLEDDGVADFVQMVTVEGIDYGFQAIPLFDDVEVRSAENAFLEPIYNTFSLSVTFPITQPLISPLADAYRSAAYGAARSYAGAPVRIFHSGVDYAAPVGTPVQAVADGLVVYSNFTELRGNVVIIDHGMGIKTGYFHLSALLVQSGDFVTQGTAIGALGNTGLSTGAHLHWDVRIRGTAINGAQWLAEPIFPFSVDE